MIVKKKEILKLSNTALAKNARVKGASDLKSPSLLSIKSQFCIIRGENVIFFLFVRLKDREECFEWATFNIQVRLYRDIIQR